MRDIKFRAWSPENKEIIYFDNKKAAKDKYIAEHLLMLMANEHIAGKDLLMQYTGLKDKNGKEIYEGDIVVQHTEWHGSYNSDYFGEHENKGVVAIVPSKGVMINRCVKRDLIECEQEWSKTWPVKLRGYRTAVVGNIHENPELLDNAK